jgi:hypothetical protein
MKAAMVRGTVAMVVWSGSALGQLPNTGTSAPPAGTGGTGAEAPPAAPAAGSAPVPAAEATPPIQAAPPPPPPPPPAPPPQADPDDEDDYEPRRRRRRKPLDWQPEDAEQPRTSSFSLRGPHFILSAERLAGVLGHTYTIEQKTEQVDVFTGQPTGVVVTRELKHTGTDVTFLGAGPESVNPFIFPRVAFDGMLSNGLTLGGSVSYFVTSGESEVPDVDGSGAIVKRESPTTTVFSFSPRLGFLLQASEKVGIWLRGGVTRVSLTTERQQIFNGEIFSTTETQTMLDVTLDPQLVISPVPHVGLLVGAAVDIGASGTLEETSNGIKEQDGLTVSSYGVTAGLAAIF